MPVTSARLPRRGEPGHQQIDLNLRLGLLFCRPSLRAGLRSAQSHGVREGARLGAQPEARVHTGSPSPPPAAPPAVPPGAWNPIHIYISQQMVGRIYNNLIMKIRFSGVLCTQGLRPRQIQLLLIYPARLQIKRHLPSPTSCPAWPSAWPGQQVPGPKQPGRGLSGSQITTSCHWEQDEGLWPESPSSPSLEARGLGQATSWALRESCPWLDLD